MEKFRYIFIFIFLSGMLFTVMRYLPILEEETTGHDVEMSKKANQDVPSSDDDSNDDDPDDEKTDLIFDHNYQYFHGLESEQTFHLTFKIYRFLVENINTPPPRV